MSEKNDRKGDPIAERVARLEVIVDNHEERLEKLGKSLEEIKEALNDVVATQKGLNFFLKNILLPIVLSVITAIVIKIL